MSERDAATAVGRRRFLQATLAASATALAPGAMARGTTTVDAVVGNVAGAYGAPVFGSVQAALDAAPHEGSRPFRILVGRGTWREKLMIDKPWIHLIGEDRIGSVISHDTAAGMRRPDGEPWGTWGCASVIVRAPDFRAERLSIRNDFDYVGNLRAPRFEAIGPNGARAVALMLDRGAERSVLHEVDLIGHQDTLFADAGRSWFRRCHIAGSVDFVFGGGNALFEECSLHSRYRPGKERQGYVAVPCTPSAQAYGLSFLRCRLTRDTEVPDASVALGRAWRPGRTFPDGKYGDPDAIGAAAYLSCWMDAHIDPLGWDAMAYTTRDGRRTMLEPQAARLYEHDSRGPGAVRTPPRRRLDRAAVLRHQREHMFGDWLPQP